MSAPSPLVPLEAALRAVRAPGMPGWYDESPITTLARQLEVPRKVVESKLLSMADRGYIEYGVSVAWPWLTEKGIATLNRPPASAD